MDAPVRQTRNRLYLAPVGLLQAKRAGIQAGQEDPMRQSKGYRTVWTVAGLAGAAALAVRGLLDLRAGGSWALLVVAGLMLVAIALRHFVYRD